MRMWYAVFAILAMFLPQLAAADPPERVVAKLNRLLDVMHINHAYRTSQEQCIHTQMTGSFSPSAEVKRRGSYYGYTPKSPFWDQVLAAHRRYAERSCKYVSLEELRAKYIQLYARYLDEKSIDTLLKFATSPVGQKVLRTQDKLIRELGQFADARSNAGAVAAQQQLEAELHKLRLQKLPDKLTKH